MDILDIFLDILLKPPQPLIGLFFLDILLKPPQPLIGLFLKICCLKNYLLDVTLNSSAGYLQTKKYKKSDFVNTFTGRERLIRTRLIRSST